MLATPAAPLQARTQRRHNKEAMGLGDLVNKAGLGVGYMFMPLCGAAALAGWVAPLVSVILSSGVLDQVLK